MPNQGPSWEEHLALSQRVDGAISQISRLKEPHAHEQYALTRHEHPTLSPLGHTHEGTAPLPPTEERAEGFGAFADAHLTGSRAVPETNAEMRDALHTPGLIIDAGEDRAWRVGNVAGVRDTALIGGAGVAFVESTLNWSSKVIENVVVRNVELVSSAGHDLADLISFNGLHVGWFDHLTFGGANDEQFVGYMWPNEGIDPGDITLSFSHFRHTSVGERHAILIGERSGFRGPEHEERTRVSIYGTWLQQWGRVPTIGGGRLDMWDIYIGPDPTSNDGGYANWGTELKYGAIVDMHNVSYMQRNPFMPDKPSFRVAITEDGDPRNALRRENVRYLDNTTRGWETRVAAPGSRALEDFGTIPEYPDWYVRNVRDSSHLEVIAGAGAK